MHKVWSNFIAIVCFAFVVPNCLAGEAPRRVLEELFITSDIRTKDWQETSDSVLVISETQSIDQGFETFSDLSIFTPGVLTLSDTLIGIRGVVDVNRKNGPIALKIDGVNQAIEASSIAQMLDVKSTEIYRGPQVINFGPHASAGAINVVRWSANEKSPNYVRASYGQDHELMSELAYGDAIGQFANFRIASRVGRHNGEDNVSGLSGDSPLGFALRGSVNWSPQDGISFIANVGYSKDQNQALQYNRVDCVDLANKFMCLPTETLGVEQSNHGWRASLQSNFALGSTKILLTSAYGASEANTLPSALHSGGTETLDQFSQELRIMSNPSSPFQWQVGAQYTSLDRLNINTRKSREDIWSIFASSRVYLGDQFFIELGTQFADQYVRLGAQEQDFSFWQYRAAINYLSDTNRLTYAKYTKTIRPDRRNFGSLNRAESGYHFEAGHKLKAVNKRVEISSLVFISKYDDFQFPVFSALSSIPNTQHAPSVKSRGIEIDGRLAATSRTVVTANVAILDSTFKSYVSPCGAIGTPTLCDRSGRHTLYAPKWSYRLGVEWIFPLPENMSLTLSTDIAVIDGYDTAAGFETLGHQRTYHTANLRVKLAPKNQSWFFAAYSRNLANANIIEQFIPALQKNSAYLLQSRGARYGVELGYNF